MKKIILTLLFLLVLTFSLTACNRGDATPQLPEAPLLFDSNGGVGLIDDFDWSTLTDQEGLDLFTQGLEGVGNAVSDFISEGLPLETTNEGLISNLDETVFQTIEEDPDELALEGGMPLVVTNPDNLGTAGGFPVVADTDTDVDLPVEVVTPPVDIVPITSLGEPEDLPKTNDVVSMAFVALAVTAGIVAILVVVKKKKAL